MTIDADAVRAAEKDRIKTILGLAEATGREGAALALALESDLTADQARELLPTLDEAPRGQRAHESPIGLVFSISPDAGAA